MWRHHCPAALAILLCHRVNLLIYIGLEVSRAVVEVS